MPNTESQSAFRYGSADACSSDSYLTPVVLDLCAKYGGRKVLDLGCGNGAFCRTLDKAGYEVTGCDNSEDGIRIAKEASPHLNFHQIGVYDDPGSLGERDFDLVVSTEVIEHLFLPGHLPRFARKVLRPGGHLIISTPYHGYLKNLVLSVMDKWDAHHHPFWDGGHVKFWSRKTLTQLLEEEGFAVKEFAGAGRFPGLWKSMVMVAGKMGNSD